MESTLQKQVANIGSFVFFDLETTGLPPAAEITEISLTAVDADCLDRFCSTPTASEQQCGLPRALQTLTVQCRPAAIGDAQAALRYDASRAAQCSQLTSADLRPASTFGDSYSLLRGFLQQLRSPLCFVAHNGFRFDLPILAKEMISNGLPELDVQCCAVDSLLAFKALDQQYIKEIHTSTRPFSRERSANDSAALNATKEWSSNGTYSTPASSVPSTPACTPKRSYKVYMDGELVQDDTMTTPPNTTTNTSVLSQTAQPVKRKLFTDDAVEQPTPVRSASQELQQLHLAAHIKQEVSVKLETTDAEEEQDSEERMNVHIDNADDEFAALVADAPAALPDRTGWSAAKCALADRGTFTLASDGRYDFSSSPSGSYALGNVWKALFAHKLTQPLAHSAQGDVQMMLMLACAHGQPFIDYCRHNALPLNLNAQPPVNVPK